ncbi:MAG TPA: bacteriohemerythrin [Paludibaculum sp.]|jgi:hemerythrin
MAYIDWSPDYDLGIAEIDRQHRRLVEIVNRLHDAMEQRSPKCAMQGVVCDLATYTEIHFAYEERMMQSVDMPDWETHCSEHRVLAREVRSFELDLASGRLSVSMELMDVLRRWLLVHVLHADRELVNHANRLHSAATLALSR